MTPEFFGPDNRGSLYGVYHRPHRPSDTHSRAIVICPPLGQEYIRTHWNLKLLAKQLARGGAHVLRFDWSGHGNSPGDMSDQTSLQTWIEDVGHAVEYIREKSNADNVMLLGLRFGATLAALTAAQRNDVHSLVAWEPVMCGEGYLQRQDTMWSRKLNLWVSPMTTRDDSERKELLGFEYARSLLDEIEQTRLNLRELYLPQLIVEREANPQKFSHVEPSLQRVLRTNDQECWYYLPTLETAWLRPETTRLIVGTIADMFDRLQRIGALELGLETAGAV